MKEALMKELSYFLDSYYDHNIAIGSIYFGGGTPSLAKPETFEEIIKSLHQRNLILPDAEITLEGNPEDCNIEKLKSFQSAGINRVSLGVQALDDLDLKYLGRKHTEKQAYQSIEDAMRVFDNVTFDLMYGRHKNQTVEKWAKELKKAIAFDNGHISLYCLTIEPGTNFHQRMSSRASNRLELPSNEHSADLYSTTVEITNGAGYLQYETSNFGREKLHSRHNLHYWSAGDYIGIGPGAAGRITKGEVRNAFKQALEPRDWMSRVERDGHGVLERNELSFTEKMQEVLMCGLRKKSGISSAMFAEHSEGKTFMEVFDAGTIRKLTEDGLVTFRNEDGGQVLKVTEKGNLLMDTVLVDLFGALRGSSADVTNRDRRNGEDSTKIG